MIIKMVIRIMVIFIRIVVMVMTVTGSYLGGCYDGHEHHDHHDSHDGQMIHIRRFS